MSADRFIRACQEDVSILRSLLDIIDEQRNLVLSRMAIENQKSEFCRFQGEARGVLKFGEHLKKLVRLRDERAADKSPNGRI
jgi:hypothetical protein